MRDRWREKAAEAALAKRFGANVARLRHARGLSQTDLGERAAIHRNDLSLIEVGRRRPRIDVLLGIAAALGVEPEALLDGIGWARADPTQGRFSVKGEARR